MIRVDTNYIIRYFVNDNIEMADLAEEILTTKNLDFVDCLLCAYSNQDEIVTFDKKLNKCVAHYIT